MVSAALRNSGNRSASSLERDSTSSSKISSSTRSLYFVGCKYSPLQSSPRDTVLSRLLHEDDASSASFPEELPKPLSALFGSLAAYPDRPVALRPRLTTGLPFSQAPQQRKCAYVISINDRKSLTCQG
jgi:hypothetical protein